MKAVQTAAKSLRDLRIAEITKLDMKIEGGKVVAYRARVSLSFKYAPDLHCSVYLNFLLWTETGELRRTKQYSFGKESIRLLAPLTL